MTAKRATKSAVTQDAGDAFPSKKEWPASSVERRSVESLVPYARNARTHSDEQVAQIAASIREWGWTTPVLVDEQDGIIAGHGRVMAARKLGIAEIPVMVARGWTEAQRRAYVIADNQLALNAGWDTGLLKVEIGELDGEGFDLALLGFDGAALAGLLTDQTEGLTDPDDVPDVPTHPVTEPGDVWLLGKHRLVCGDSTDADVVAKCMGGAQADFSFTSPPYSQQRQYGGNMAADWDDLMAGVFSILPVKDGAQVLVNLGLVHDAGEWRPYWDKWIEFMRGAGWKRFALYVWDQGPGLPGDWNGRLAPSFELVFHFCREARRANKSKQSKHAGAENHRSGLRRPDGTVCGYSHAGRHVQQYKIMDNVIRVMRHKARGEECKHPAVFPVQLPIELMEAYTKEGDVCFEPFSGSGTQLISAEKTGRICHAIELSPEYVDVAIKRWQEFTGKDATLDGDGRTFAEIEAGRHGENDEAA